MAQILNHRQHNKNNFNWIFILSGRKCYAMEVIFLIIIKTFILEILEVFLGEKELCADFANGLYTACFTLDQLVASIYGSILNNYLGYSRTGTCYALFALFYFILYWTFIRKKNYVYDNMIDEEEIANNQTKEKIKI